MKDYGNGKKISLKKVFLFIGFILIISVLAIATALVYVQYKANDYINENGQNLIGRDVILKNIDIDISTLFAILRPISI